MNEMRMLLIVSYKFKNYNNKNKKKKLEIGFKLYFNLKIFGVGIIRFLN